MEHPFSDLMIIHEVISIFMAFVMILTSPVWKEYGDSDRSEKVLVPANACLGVLRGPGPWLLTYND